MKINSSIFLGAEEAGKSSFSIQAIVDAVVSVVGQFIYFVCKWMLYFVDILFFYIQQLVGLNTDTSSINSMLSKDSDMVFNFLLSNNEIVTKIIRNLLAFSLILLIIFTIFVIIKNSFDSLKSDKSKSPADVLKSSFKAILLMVITPLIAIFGILASNVLLKALYNATKVTGTSSLGTQIFTASTGNANRYRQYALNNERIPIIFDFTQEEVIFNSYAQSESKAGLKEYLSSTSNSIYATHLKFQDSNFDSYYALEDTQALDNYYKTYDKSPLVNQNLSNSSVMKIYSYAEEYYVMADLVDYAISSSNVLYIKTIEEVFDSVLDIPNEDEGKKIINDIASTFSITLNGTPESNPSTTSYYDYLKANNWSYLQFTNKYFSPDENGEALTEKQVEYTHLKNAKDQALGGVFIITGQRSIQIGGSTYFYYYPVSRGYIESNAEAFYSDYLQLNQMVIAKGIFDSNGYPTAIKKSNTDSKVVFYRENLEAVTLGEAGDVFKTDFELSENEEQQEEGFFTKVANFFKKLFSMDSWVPSLNFNEDEMMITYTKVTTVAGELEGGQLHLGYIFTDDITSKISSNLYGLKLEALFNPLSVNYLVLMLGSALLLKMCFVSVSALIKRAYELFLLILVYPVSCSTYPLDSGKGYEKWYKSYIAKLFVTYGLLLGINFVLMLFPIINSIEFFKPHELAESKVVGRFASIFTAVGVSINTQTNMLNFIIAIMFQLVAFSFLADPKSGGKDSYGIYKSIMRIVDPNSKDDLYADNPSAMMLNTVKSAANMFGTIITFGGLHKLASKENRKKIKEEILAFQPGSAILKEAQDRKGLLDAKKEEKKASAEVAKAQSGDAKPSAEAGSKPKPKSGSK